MPSTHVNGTRISHDSHNVQLTWQNQQNTTLSYSGKILTVDDSSVFYASARSKTHDKLGPFVDGQSFSIGNVTYNMQQTTLQPDGPDATTSFKGSVKLTERCVNHEKCEFRWHE